MASLNQIISEIAHSVKQADNVAAKESIKLSIIQAREKVIRQSCKSNNLIDRTLITKYIIKFNHNVDGNNICENNIIQIPQIIRLGNESPLISLRYTNFNNKLSEPIPFINNSSSKYYSHLPGFCSKLSYDYIENIGNDYNENMSSIILYDKEHSDISELHIECINRYPIELTFDEENYIHKFITNFDNQNYIPNDMILDIKKLVLEVFNPQVIRDTNEQNPTSLIK